MNGKTYNVYKTYPNISGEGTEKDAAIFRYASKMAIKGDYSRIAFGTYIGGVLDILQIDDTLGISPVKTLGIYKPVYAKVKNSPDAITWGMKRLSVLRPWMPRIDTCIPYSTEHWVKT